MRVFVWICLMACFLMTASAFAQRGAADPLTGTWTGDWGPTPNAVALQKSTFDSKSGAVHMEADAKAPGGRTVHYLIDGKVDRNTMTGSWNHDNRNGDFKITKN